MWQKIKQFISGGIGFYTALFVFLYLTAWALNAVNNMYFDLDRLKDIYIWLMTQMNATHAVNSVFNSPKGMMPGENQTIN